MENSYELLQKQIKISRLIMLFLAIIMVAVVITSAVIVVNVSQMQQAMADIGEVAQGLSRVDWDAIGQQVEQSLHTTNEALDALDFAGLNQAISDLKTVIQPLADLMGRFG